MWGRVWGHGLVLASVTAGGNLHLLLEGITRQKQQQWLKIFTRLPGDMSLKVALARCLKTGGRAVGTGIRGQCFG